MQINQKEGLIDSEEKKKKHDILKLQYCHKIIYIQ